jgi:hypothetical protein
VTGLFPCLRFAEARQARPRWADVLPGSSEPKPTLGRGWETAALPRMLRSRDATIPRRTRSWSCGGVLRRRPVGGAAFELALRVGVRRLQGRRRRAGTWPAHDAR